ncbi:MAG: hypothetical protein GXY05_00305 [Clostridiales bacterium]|nr:hypothetical protein [Clostridiales bacterium]
MLRKKKLLITLGVIVAVAFISGVSILAATNFGTTNDPLVTLSYLTQKLKPQIMAEVSTEVGAAQAALQPSLDAKVNEFKANIDAKLGTSPGTTAESAAFTLVTLSKNQTLTCAVGTELLLRIGTATAAGSAPALVDSTTGSTLSSGGALAANHMYMVTIQGNGLKATATTVRVLVRGTYTVG